MTTEWTPPAKDRVRERTSEAANARIDRQTRGALDEANESPEARQRRLGELDREWTVDRALMLNFAVLGGLSGGLAMRSLARHGKLGGWGEICAERVALERDKP